ncbi:class III extradiol ring-cleavage dioxygenase family protein [Kineobactrum salinum]|uniref:Extradiol ring-cleavage dioxygenase class III enzyme subunit B domain-containing protein n=1 Tax=Kineobactrum salinum TaxID=2708301 RepID=A0A6C0U5Y3_9GAMM|nr:hypothetical protein [Kineobactrum salinum]QIB67406.1 hypothetical protein G3T16_20435 [Kineobactrum salinum]
MLQSLAEYVGLDPVEHLALGRALAPLRRSGVLIIGSGMSYHNMGRFSFNNTDLDPDSVRFDEWLAEVVELPTQIRDQRLTAWAAAPRRARFASARGAPSAFACCCRRRRRGCGPTRISGSRYR